MPASVVENITFVASINDAARAAEYLKSTVMPRLADNQKVLHTRLARVKSAEELTASFALECGFASSIDSLYWQKHVLADVFDLVAKEWGQQLMYFHTRLDVIA